MIRILFALSLVFASVSASATDIQLRPGATATIRAGDQATVTCGGGGGGGGNRDRCQCIVGLVTDHPGIPCTGGAGYVLLIGGTPVASDGCWGGGGNGYITAGNACRSKLQGYSECK